MKSLSMKIPIVLFLGAVLGCLTLAASAAMYSVDTGAPVVKLRKSCTESGATLKNCFDTVTSLNSWINATRKPNSTKPLLVEIGPGTFKGTNLSCISVSHITYRGSGSEKTTIDSIPTVGGSGAGLMANNCTEISVENLTLLGLWGVHWTGVGNSTWNNVTVRGWGYGWIEEPLFACPVTGGGKHYWFSSRIIADPASFGLGAGTAKGYGVFCGQSWFFGTEILAVGGGAGGVRALYVNGNNNEAHVYGGVIRAVLSSGETVLPPGLAGSVQEEGNGLFAALANGNGRIHIHGTGIDVIGNSLGNDIAALIAGNGGEIHANEAAYNLSTGSGGKIYRIINSGGHVHAPYLWEPHKTLPVNAGSTTNLPGNELVSLDGTDIAVVTTPGGTPKMVIYSTACTSKWFDVSANACRP